MDWQESGVEGQYRFLGRVYRLITRNAERVAAAPPVALDSLKETDRRALRKLHQTIGKITLDFEQRWHFNTSIAALMELTNELYACEDGMSPAALRETLEALVLLLEPFTPFIAEELWTELGRTGPVFRQSWPVVNEAYLVENEIEIPVQVNGKLRGKIVVAKTASSADVEAAAKADEKVQAFLKDKEVLKTIVLAGKLVNIVVKG
jgi:leucyl-tRNA synthetase